MNSRIRWIFLLPALVVCGVLQGGAAQQPSRSPAKAAPAGQPAPRPAAKELAEPVVGQLEPAGWGLVGSGGRHYVFGGLAIADYTRQGQRYIVTLQQEEPTLLPKSDDNYLYYRELGTGHRWAIGRYPLADDSYAIYFQPEPAATNNAKALAKAKWTLFHRAQLIWPEKQGKAPESHPQMTQLKKGQCTEGP